MLQIAVCEDEQADRDGKNEIKAPSSKNRQSWKYIVIQGKSKEEMLKVFRQGIEKREEAA